MASATRWGPGGWTAQTPAVLSLCQRFGATAHRAHVRPGSSLSVLLQPPILHPSLSFFP